MTKRIAKQPDTSVVNSGQQGLSRKQALKAGAIAIGGAAGLSALDGAGTALASAPARASRATDVKLSYWTFDTLSIPWFLQRAKEWEKQYPQYRFTYDFTQVPYADLFTKVLANLAAGSGAPDMVAIEISAFSRFMKGGIAAKGLVDLTPYVGAERQKFLRWEPYMYKGRLYGAEYGLSPAALYYRTDILQQAGITAPLDTYDDLLAAGRILAKQGKYILLVGKADITVFMEMFQQVGGHLFDASGTLGLDDPRAVQVLTFLVNGAKEKLFFTPPDPYGAPGLAALKLGKVATVLMPDWYGGFFLKPLIKAEAGKWRIQPLPVFQKGQRRVSTWGGTGLAITKQTKHVDLVWNFVHYCFMTEKNQVKRYQSMGNNFPTMIEATRDPAIVNVPDPYFGGQKAGGIFGALATQVPQQYQSPFWSEALTALGNEYTNAMLGKKTPATAIKDATATIAKAMAKGS